MPTEQYIWQMADGSINGTLSPAAMEELELLLATDPAFAQAYQEQLSLLQSLTANGQHRRFKGLLKTIHAEQLQAKPKTKVFSLKPQYLRAAAIAAGVALFTSLSTMWMMQHNSPKVTEKIQLLDREIGHIKQTQSQQNRQINSIAQQQNEAAPIVMPPSSLAGTGFALTNDGYIVTNYHVTEGADSIYIQTRDGEYYKAHLFAVHPKTDLAILKVDDPSFRFGKVEIPYTFAPVKAALGTRIFTLGYPQNDIVYNEGYISSRNGYEGDSMQYRLEVAASAGQSGSPVMDNAGNVIGVIKSKDNEAEGTTYAISSNALLRLLRDLPKEANLHLARSNNFRTFSREQQIERLQDYTCMIQVYKTAR